MAMDYDLRRHCHVNSNEDGDRFVGIKADSENATVYFPIGYDLPEKDAEIRADIRHLVQVLSEFTSKEERLLAAHRSSGSQHVEFPINAFRIVIEYFLGNGCKYYQETDMTYKTSTTGRKDWQRTVRKHMPLIQRRNGISSFVYTKFEVKAAEPNETKLITQINRFCVYEAFLRLGWLYVPTVVEQPGAHPDIKTSRAIVRTKLHATNDDKKRELFQAMGDMLDYLDDDPSDRDLWFGTYDFDRVWEKMIDKAFGEPDKDRYFPRSRWLLSYGKYHEKYPLMPDTVMIHDGKYYILDAKCYRYGVTGVPAHLPNSSSINKQITYGEYLEKYIGVSADSLFNAFIMPFNSSENPFGISDAVGNIGEAVGDWRENIKYYERIQGIVLDTRQMMYRCFGRAAEEKAALAECIEAVIDKGKVPAGNMG